MNQNQIVEIIKKQRAFFSSGITLAVNYRITALKKLYAAVQQNEEAIAHIKTPIRASDGCYL